MGEVDEDSRREKLRQLAAFAVGGNAAMPGVYAKGADASAAQIGTGSKPITDAYIGEDELDWLLNELRGGGKLYVDNLELETSEGTVRFEADEDILVVTFDE